MAKLHEGGHCPKCDEGKLRRTRRRLWMHWLPASKYYKCDTCRARFLTILSWTIAFSPKKRQASVAD
jgi:hypothetical protein